jgi:hypothetical protein
MWVFTNNSFFSIVKNRDDPNGVVVRARVPGDLTRTFGKEHNVIELSDSDYRFRMFLDHDYVTKVVAENVSNIDYDNFKNSIDKKDIERYRHYTEVWYVMYDWQDKLLKIKSYK